MNILLVLGILMSLVLAFLAWRKSSGVQSELGRMKALLNIMEKRIMELPDHQQESLTPLRVQLLRLASGTPVTTEMVFSGRPFPQVSPADAQRLFEQENENVFWLDVRNPEAYRSKKIPGAYLIPIEELGERCAAEIPDRSEKILVYCESGMRSREACDLLSRQGYINVVHLKEGLSKWQGPLESETEPQLIRIQSAG